MHASPGGLRSRPEAFTHPGEPIAVRIIAYATDEDDVLATAALYDVCVTLQGRTGMSSHNRTSMY